jgi:hypothetical protein
MVEDMGIGIGGRNVQLQEKIPENGKMKGGHKKTPREIPGRQK